VADGTSSEVADSLIEAVRMLGRLGALVVKVAMPDVTPCIAVWMALCGPEAAAAHEATYPAKAAEYAPAFVLFLKSV
jgi:amidase